MSDENGSPELPPNNDNKSFDDIVWLLPSFLPGVIFAMVVLLSSDAEATLRERNVWLWLISTACYLFGLTLVHGKKNQRRGADLVTHSFVMTVGLLSANFVLFGILRFAGCVCAVSGFSRLNY